MINAEITASRRGTEEPSEKERYKIERNSEEAKAYHGLRAVAMWGISGTRSKPTSQRLL